MFYMRQILVIFSLLCSVTASSATWDEQNKKEGLQPPSENAAVVLESQDGTWVLRYELLSDGRFFERVIRKQGGWLLERNRGQRDDVDLQVHRTIHAFDALFGPTIPATCDYSWKPGNGLLELPALPVSSLNPEA